MFGSPVSQPSISLPRSLYARCYFQELTHDTFGTHPGTMMICHMPCKKKKKKGSVSPAMRDTAKTGTHNGRTHPF